MSKLSDVLDKKGYEVFTVSPKESVLDAIRQMTEKAIGTAVVLEDGKLVGIVSERDFIRKVVVAGKDAESSCVADIMTRQVFVEKPDSLVEDCLQLMTGKRIRHCPVMNGNELAGIVSIGDLVKFRLSEQAAAIRDYQQYIYQAY
ncbi:MAG: CBS domain-containing protein [Kiritimatiellae bacterium]|nr:CBS domain-containing protein [Kiritimatiellia bacterium]MDD4736321.1 CBS domain-containing protein [Kiritimatiellia bacterium]